MDGINIADVLSKETTQRPEIKESIKMTSKAVVEDAIKSNDFDDKIEEILEQSGGSNPVEHIQPIEPEVVNEPEDELDHEQSAEALIDLVDIAQKSLFIFLGARKLKKQIPEDLMNTFISLDIKEMRGQELTELEQKQLQRYKDFTHRIDRLADEIPFTDEEKHDLMKCSTAFVKKAGIKISPSLWFGAQLFSMVSQRAIQLATT